MVLAASGTVYLSLDPSPPPPPLPIQLPPVSQDNYQVQSFPIGDPPQPYPTPSTVQSAVAPGTASVPRLVIGPPRKPSGLSGSTTSKPIQRPSMTVKPTKASTPKPAIKATTPIAAKQPTAKPSPVYSVQWYSFGPSDIKQKILSKTPTPKPSSKTPTPSSRAATPEPTSRTPTSKPAIVPIIWNQSNPMQTHPVELTPLPPGAPTAQIPVHNPAPQPVMGSKSNNIFSVQYYYETPNALSPTVPTKQQAAAQVKLRTTAAAAPATGAGVRSQMGSATPIKQPDTAIVNSTTARRP